MDCRSGILAGVDKLADAVQVTLGPKARSALAHRFVLILVLDFIIYNYYTLAVCGCVEVAS